MKLFDKFLKILNVNRNTFFTYILTLLTVYLAIDRIVEMLILIFTGVASSYWNPIQYTLALACPVFAFAFSAKSSFSDTRAAKVTLFYTFSIGLYIIALSLFVQSINAIAWLAFMSVPNYVTIITDFSELIKPAFCSLALLLPLTTIYPFVKFILLKVDDSQLMIKSIWDFTGINLSPNDKKAAAYACNLSLFKDFDSGKKISINEPDRFSSFLVCGASGSGKTSMLFEPMIAQDIEKKYFFSEAAKDLGFTALKTGIANLVKPYSNEYLNKNFNLNMLTPSFGKDTIFNTFVKKMAISTSPYIYKNIGITYISPDYDTLDQMMKICNNYNVGYNIIDPTQPEKSLGLNPFVYDDPSKIAVIISSALKGIIDKDAASMKDLYKEEASLQILENLSILLKEIYPRMNDGALPNLEDLLTLLSNFELVEKMCKIMEADNELAKKHQMELAYFKRSFFGDSKGREETEKIAFIIAGRLENLLRAPKIRFILCNRHTNINFDDVLANGDVTFLCTRRGDSGKIAHTAFGLFFLLSMQHAVLSRPGSEKTRIPHFLYIDEFPDFVSQDTETMFTMYRKYKVATTISAQSISQFNYIYGQNSRNNVILSNCASKVMTGGSMDPEELEWWAKELGQWKQWKFGQDYDGKTGQMGTTLKDPKYDYVTKMGVNRLQNLGLNRCGYKIMQNGHYERGDGIMYRVASKYKEPHKSKNYDFSNVTNTSGDSNKSSNKNDSIRRRKFSLGSRGSKNKNEPNPIKYSETKYNFSEEDGGIVIDLKHDNNN